MVRSVGSWGVAWLGLLILFSGWMVSLWHGRGGPWAVLSGLLVGTGACLVALSSKVEQVVEIALADHRQAPPWGRVVVFGASWLAGGLAWVQLGLLVKRKCPALFHLLGPMSGTQPCAFLAGSYLGLWLPILWVVILAVIRKR